MDMVVIGLRYIHNLFDCQEFVSRTAKLQARALSHERALLLETWHVMHHMGHGELSCQTSADEVFQSDLELQNLQTAC